MNGDMRPVVFAPYENCTVLPPDSQEIMFRCDRDRMAWYLGRGLAALVTKDPPVIRLTFRPRGPGHAGDPYFIQEFKNRCVVCGSEKDLSHHHIVPDAYRRYFPRDSQQLGRWMYDVLLLCLGCHKRYEKAASELKERIASEYGVPSSGIVNLDLVRLRAMKAAAALCRHGERIPQPKRVALIKDVRKHLGKDDFDQEELYAVWKNIRRSVKTVPAGKIIAGRLADIDDFAVRWRRHFMKTMKPGCLPDGWDPERRIYAEPDQVEGKTP